MTTLFMSYAHGDRKEVQRLAREFHDLGFDIWIDTRGLVGGTLWESEIVKAIKNCDFFLLFISSNSIRSDSVRRELDIAYKNKKNIIPLRLEKVSIPPEWEFQTIGIQWIECSEGGWKSRLLVALGDRGIRGENNSWAIAKPSSEKEKWVQIIFNLEPDDFNDVRKEEIRAVLAALLRVDKDDIRILSVHEGSIVLEVVMPEKAMNRLFDLAQKRDYRLIEQGILSIFFDLDDLTSQIHDYLNEDNLSVHIDSRQRNIEIKLKPRRLHERSAAQNEKRFQWSNALTAIISASAVIIAAIVGYIGVIKQISLPIAATQTAEALRTPPISVIPTTPIVAPLVFESFNANQGFQSTSNRLKIANGKIFWDVRRNEGDQYLYQNIPTITGNVRLTVVGQINESDGNCAIGVGIGDKLGSGMAINFGYYGTGCSQQGTVITASGATFNMQESYCNFTGDWLWINPKTPTRVELTTNSSSAELAVEGIGKTTGSLDYMGDYNLLWVGMRGNGDSPYCSGEIHSIEIEPLP